MVSADPCVDLKEKFFALGNRDALHEYASRGRAAFVELAIDGNEGLGPSCDLPGFIPISGEDIVKDVR